MCSTSSSRIWYKGPASLANRVLCFSCGIYWRKYAAETFNPDLVSINTRNKSSTATAAAPGTSEDGLGVAPPSKLARTTRDGKAVTPGTSPIPMPAPVFKPEPLKCVMCKRIEPKKKLAQCRQCSLSVHQGCYGLTDAEVEADQWLCDPCNNEQSQEAALLPRCILCSSVAQEDAAAVQAKYAASLSSSSEGKPRGRPKVSTMTDDVKRETLAKAPLGALDAFKPTECNNWAHVLCSIFIPEVVFSDTARLKTVESCGNLPTHRYEALCELCKVPTGACVACSDPGCKREFHVSCAWNNQPGFTLAFEIIPVKYTRRDVTPTLTFKTETGQMVPQVWCKEHKETAKTKKLYDLAEVDPKTGLTSLQMFVRANKALASTGDAGYALLRRAKRYDALVNDTQTSAVNKSLSGQHTPLKQKSCTGCNASFSPFWWSLPTQGRVKEEGEERVDASWSCHFCRETRYKALFGEAW